MERQHSNRGEERGREHAGGHVTDAGRRQGNRQTHDAQRRAGEQHEGDRRGGGQRTQGGGQQHGGGRQSQQSHGGGHGHETAGQAREHARTTLQGSETIITPMTDEGGGAGADRGIEQYRYGGEARSTHGHRGERTGSQQTTGGRQHTGGQQRTGGQRTTGGGQHHAGQRTSGGGQHGGQRTTGGHQGSGHQSGGNRGGGHQRGGGEDTAEMRRRYSHSTEQTQYGGNLDDQPSAIEQTRTRENQPRTEGHVEGGNQNRQRHGTPQGEQGRSTRQGQRGSGGDVHSHQEQTHGEMQFGGGKGGSERDRRYGSRHGHGSERRH